MSDIKAEYGKWLEQRRGFDMPVWVHKDGWAGRTKHPGTIMWLNPKRSMVRLETGRRLVPNESITPRHTDEAGAVKP